MGFHRKKRSEHTTRESQGHQFTRRPAQSGKQAIPSPSG
ncbi:hypothetical protein WQQ_19510 [Hydrocarboniphaga effusa AP103]|uniref:Uncharacterized protein n=1 Tax=Hydrocarboniphaga effusa AP103 TaxID=1172194 RepID=I7ZIR4_9GAMM|nr:hypothetical protein WQQ_19510 [Hydrocarboniphaga effusa AP103]